ncbi:MAG: hypothetical protein B7X58_01120, partial [Marinobacter sp. 34-60-7]
MRFTFVAAAARDPPSATATKLRNKVEPSQYKHVVLGLIFLKYVSDTFDVRRRELERLVQTEGSDYYMPTEAARQSIALREETNLLTRAVQELDAAQAKQVLQRMEEPYRAAKDEARNYAAQIEWLRRFGLSLEDSYGIDGLTLLV